ncbi:hypothetical protein Q3G72_029167 [Acer saccharum]|nr:hypothetical protein Q3G72_029167 [Acer saccharum]
MVSLKYERLPEFCYVCGRIGHASKECFDETAKIEALKGVSTKFGSWMRASVLDRQKMKFDQNSVRNSKVQSSLEERREGIAEGLQILSSGDVRRGEDDGGLMAVRSGSAGESGDIKKVRLPFKSTVCKNLAMSGAQTRQEQ